MAEQRVIPMLAYEDAGLAADWICKVFGFRETERFHNGQGTVTDVVLERDGERRRPRRRGGRAAGRTRPRESRPPLAATAGGAGGPRAARRKAVRRRAPGTG